MSKCFYGERMSLDPKDVAYNVWHRKKLATNGWEFNITPQDIVVPGVCPILGIPLVFHKGRGSYSDSPSVDRIDSTKGYIPGNVWVISRRANSMKSNASREDLLKFAFWVYKTYLTK